MYKNIRNLIVWFLVIFPIITLKVSAQHSTITGKIQDSLSGIPISDALIELSMNGDSHTVKKHNVTHYTKSNNQGDFVLKNIVAGKYTVTARQRGYNEYVHSFFVNGDTANIQVNIKMIPLTVRSQNVLIEGNKLSAEKSISTVKLNAQMIARVPPIFGESDVTKILQLMPGIKSSSEVSSGLYIRGGSPDQNIILLDGVPLYNPMHLGGIFSVFNGDALENVKLIKGGFPAEYGGRLSGVVDITMRDGTDKPFAGKANLGLIASRLTLEGALSPNMTFMVSGRRTYLELPYAIVKTVSNDLPTLPDYSFYDVNAKLTFTPSDKDKFIAHIYIGADVFYYTAPDTTLRGAMRWGNTLLGLRWTHIFSPSVFTNTSAYYTGFYFGTDIDLYDDPRSPMRPTNPSSSIRIFSQIQDIGLRSEAEYLHSEEHTLKAGIEAVYHRFLTLTDSKEDDLQTYLSFLGASRTIPALEIAGYVQDEWKPDSLFRATLGVRAVYFDQGNRFRIEPRLALSYNLTDEISLKGSFGIANQFLHLVSRNDVTILPTDTWFPSTTTLQPAQSLQYILGTETHLFDREWLLTIEGYYKSMQHLYEFRDNAQFTLLAPAESQLTEGTGEAYGTEVFIQKRFGNITGWLGYTLAWTSRTFPELNRGKAFPPRYDRRHDISLIAQYTFNEEWECSLTWVYATGQAFTMPSAQFDFTLNPSPSPYSVPQPQLQYTARNGGRLPPFHKLDVSITHNFSWWNLPFQASLSVYNAYNRYNAFSWSVDYNQVYVPAHQRSGWAGNIQQLSLLGILPTLNISARF